MYIRVVLYFLCSARGGVRLAYLVSGKRRDTLVFASSRVKRSSTDFGTGSLRWNKAPHMDGGEDGFEILPSVHTFMIM